MTAHETEQSVAKTNGRSKKSVGETAAKIMKMIEELPEEDRVRVISTIQTLYGA